MNQIRLENDAPCESTRYGTAMRVLDRARLLGPGTVLDVSLAVAGIGLIVAAEFVPVGPAGPAVRGPAWLLVLLPLLTGAPLAVRRHRPLLMWTVMWAGVSLQALVTGTAPAAIGLTLVLLAGGYSLAAYSTLPRAVAGLLVMGIGLVICIVVGDAGAGNPNVFGGSVIVESASRNMTLAGEILALWLTGIAFRARKRSALLAARNAELDHEAERAVAAERARIAREMHDIVAHHLSVVILMAAGSRASGKPSLAALEKIEDSGRQALTETRRLLSVLRGPDESADLVPQPGLGELNALADSVRSAGLPVHLAVDGDQGALPAAVAVSAYRIVQESLTNVLKHAGPARARVTVNCTGDAVTIEVTDDGTGTPATVAAGVRHGLAGMRERVAAFGGDLRAGPEPGGGFAVRARLLLHERPPLINGTP
jgi:signal transduction histidine kinase